MTLLHKSDPVLSELNPPSGTPRPLAFASAWAMLLWSFRPLKSSFFNALFHGLKGLHVIAQAEAKARGLGVPEGRLSSEGTALCNKVILDSDFLLTTEVNTP